LIYLLLGDEMWQYWIKPMRKDALPERTKAWLACTGKKNPRGDLWG